MANRDVGNLRTRLSWEDDGSTRSLTRFKEDLRGLRSEMKIVTSQGRDYSTSLKGMRDRSEILNRTLKTQQERVKELKHRYDESVKAKDVDAKQTRELAAQYNEAVAEMQRTEQQLKNLNAAIEEKQNPWKRLSAEMIDAGDRMQEFGRKATDFGKSYSMRVTAPIVASGVAVFKAASDYESAFAGVAKTFSGTEEQLADLRVGIREMAKEIPASTTEIAAVAEAAGQLGIKAENIEEFTRVMIDLGEATNMTAETGATEFARFANIVGMSQGDFDRLGSVVVELGNNLATTEAEIVSMAMRLAGAGAQIGLTEAEIMAFSGALSSVGIEAEAGGSAFSKVMVNMQLAAERGGDELKAFADVAGVSASDFKKAFEKDAASAMISFIQGLSTVEDRGLTAIGVLDEMGITEVRMRDALLRAAGASDVFTDAIDLGSKAWKENTALTDEAAQRYATTESQLKIMWNRVKDLGISLGEALIPAIMDLIDAAEPLIRKVEEGAQAFADMTREEQETILKMIALVAAVGPAAIAIGTFSTGIGGALKLGGQLAAILGTVGGKGLLGKFGLMAASAGPVGLATVAVGGLAAGIYAVWQNSKDLNELNYELMNSIGEEIEAIDSLEARFQELYKKNQLSTDELLRFMDAQDKIKTTSDPQVIEHYENAMKRLLEKSGFTNDELQEFIDLNNDIIAKNPEIIGAISEQGNAFVENLEVVKELNATQRENLMMEASAEVTKAVENHTELIRKRADLENEINEMQTERSGLYDQQREAAKKVNEANADLLAIDQEIETVQERLKGLSGDAYVQAELELATLHQKRGVAQANVREVENERKEVDKLLEKLTKQIGKKEETLGITKEELEATQGLIDDFEVLVTTQVGINAKKGEGLALVNDAIKKNKDEQRVLLEQLETGQLSTKEFEKQNDKLITQRKRLEDAKDQLEHINDLAGETIYDKDVHIKTKTDKTYDNLGKDITKTIRTSVIGTAAVNQGTPTRMYASGTNSHPGGEFIAGEAGWEIGRLGNKIEILTAGLYSRPAGYQVFPHEESKKMLGNIPAYAEGTGARSLPSLGNDAVVSTLQEQNAILKQLLNKNQHLYADGQKIAEVVNSSNAVNDTLNYFG